MRREVKRVLDAIGALEQIPDAGERARAVGEVLAHWPEQHRKLRELRQQAVLVLRTQGMSWAEIGDALGIHRQRARQIAEGITGGQKRQASTDEEPDTVSDQQRNA